MFISHYPLGLGAQVQILVFALNNLGLGVISTLLLLASE